METSSEKEKILKVVQDLPPEANIEEAMERLYLLYKVRKGLHQADQGQTISHEKAKQHLKEWLK